MTLIDSNGLQRNVANVRNGLIRRKTDDLWQVFKMCNEIGFRAGCAIKYVTKVVNMICCLCLFSNRLIMEIEPLM